ncbi:MAG: hypothetical protein MJE77_41025 [Proteobacteria bacterium]|nr:hypothetical protein [Pseudomonadota bacterium]
MSLKKKNYPNAERERQAPTYEKPTVKTLNQEDLLSAVNKGSKFPARGFAG